MPGSKFVEQFPTTSCSPASIMDSRDFSRISTAFRHSRLAAAIRRLFAWAQIFLVGFEDTMRKSEA